LEVLSSIHNKKINMKILLSILLIAASLTITYAGTAKEW
jgi:hypothetical protein